MRRRLLRTRILVATAAIALGVLVLAGAGTVALARRSAVEAAETELARKATPIVAELESLQEQLSRREAQLPRPALGLRTLVSTVLRTTDANVVVVTPDGDVEAGLFGEAAAALDARVQDNLELPPGISVGDLDVARLRAGETQTGRRGDTVFRAEPLPPDGRGVPVAVLTQEIDPDPLGRVGAWYLATAGGALVVALVAGWYLARRLTRPIAVMDATARRIAAGDLSARVALPSRTDDELAGLARTLNGMVTQLEHARGVERAFIMSVSHDLRTPLTSIRGYAEAVVDGVIDSGPDQVRAARVIAAEARRLERLVADLLMLARLDARQFTLTPLPVDATQTIRTAVEAFEPAARDHGLRLEVVAPGAITADVDPERLAQIVANLVENALRYARSTVTVRVGAVGVDLVLDVIDDGPGIASDEITRVFDRLYTTRPGPGRTVGTGLGLAIVRELTTAMGGEAIAVAEPGRGARFTVRLPVAGRAVVETEPVSPST